METKRKWNPEVIENVQEANFDLKVYDQILEEVARIIYSDFCQLYLDSNSDSFNVENTIFLQRTGTDA